LQLDAEIAAAKDNEDKPPDVSALNKVVERIRKVHTEGVIFPDLNLV